ncbi:22808_t:CDS:2 [Cetraspora pellucida]|uniref:22808_t:CDS:1 n=1 Tax=Cetraspora pellucida TaxID=1433469 RepID=A0A9N8WJZ0_9GLOM|nr:22808_t:CDS:2 [Cetraspora pellucida]
MMEYVFVDDLHRYKRLKVTRACESCRRRKVKCDGGSGGSQTPCSSCRKLKIDCIFSNMAMKRAAPKSEQEQMDERLQRSETYTGRANYILSLEGMVLKKNGIYTEPPLPCDNYSESGYPTPEIIQNLIGLYFANVHPYVPILNKNDFIRRLNDKNNPISPLLFYSVLAIGARFSDDPVVRLDPLKPETADLLDDFFDAPRLSTIQAQILLLKFQEGMRRPGFFFRSWLYFGTILRMAQDLDLEKNLEKWNLEISREDMIVRKRVWQTCFIYDQLMGGRDTAIFLSNTDIDLPLKSDFDDEQELQIHTEFVHFVRLIKILSSVLSTIASAGSGNSLQAWSSNPKFQTLDTALDAWLQALPPGLRYQQLVENNNGVAPQTSHFACFINILYHTVIILLHRPYISNMENGKITHTNPNHLNICTVAANTISSIVRMAHDRWGPLVFQYPIRGGNYGVYCMVAASMIHLVNMSSPDLRFSKPAHDHLLSTLSVLKVCVDHSSAWELRDKVHALEAAFTAQMARQSHGLLFHPGSHPGSPVNGHMNRQRLNVPIKRATNPNTQGMMMTDSGQHYLPNNLSNNLQDNFSQFPQSSSPPRFNERPLYLLAEGSDQHFFTPEQNQPFEFLPSHNSVDGGSLISSSINSSINPSIDPSIDQSINHQSINHQSINHQSINHQSINHQSINHQTINHQSINPSINQTINPIGLSTPITLPTSHQFNPLLPLNGTKQLEISCIDSNNTFWDANSLYIWPNTTASQQMWTNNGGSPLSISTPASTTSASGHQSPEHDSPYSHSGVGSPAGSVVDPVIVASQTHDMMMSTENVSWFQTA